MNGSVTIGSSNPDVQIVWKTAMRAAASNATILIMGETGTGKEVLAREIHKASRRSSGPFVAINCGAIAESLLESELFGHEKGSFTGAGQSHEGVFEQAAGGTLFLDEIGDISPALQVKLLRVLQEREIRRVGGNQIIKVDVRLLVATHRDIYQLLAAGSFRQDLFYRIKVISLNLPPLRDRTEDIPDFVRHFIAAANREHEKAVAGISDEAMQILLRYPWHGNIRELANAIEQAVVLADGSELAASDLPAEVQINCVFDMSAMSLLTPPMELPAEGLDLRKVIRAYEEMLIAQALTRANGNRTEAAVLLGMNRTTLVEKLRRTSPSASGPGNP